MTAIRLFDRVRKGAGPTADADRGVDTISEKQEAETPGARTGAPVFVNGSDMVLTGKTEAAYLSYRGRQRSAMFFNNNRNALEFIKSGAVFTRTRDDRTVETATVLSVASDTFGIPHVRYELFCEKPYAIAGFSEGTRVLALKTFTEMYRERMAH